MRMIKHFIIYLINCVSRNTRERFACKEADYDEISCSAEDCEFIASSSNIIKIKNEGKNLYLKECRIHSKFSEYLANVIEDYFDLVSKSKNTDMIKRFILQDLSDVTLREVYAKLNRVYDDHFRNINKYNYTGWDPCEAGLTTISIEANKGNDFVIDFLSCEFMHFIEYIRNDVNAYEDHLFVSENEYQTTGADNSVATYILSRFLDIEDLVIETKYIWLNIGENHRKLCSCTEQAVGCAAIDMKLPQKSQITGEFYRQLFILSLYDVICFQRDHNQENYFVQLKDDKVNSVLAFDNDSKMTFFPLNTVTNGTSIGCSTVIDEGYINRPFIDEEFCDKLQSTDLSKIFELLSPYISKMQIWALKHRIIRVNKAIERTRENNPNIFLGKSRWKLEMCDEELAGKYGNTYLYHYCNCFSYR